MGICKQAYTPELKELAVGRMKLGRSIAGTARELGLIEQTLRNWVKVAVKGALTGLKETINAEQMQISRFRAELIRNQRELEILNKAAAYFARDAL